MWRRFSRVVVVFAEFAAAQGLVQVFTALAGIIIVRSLSKPEYALFAIANSMQVACSLLADLGIGMGVRSIGGKVWNDKARFGSLLNTAITLRRQFMYGAVALCIPTAGWLLVRNNATPAYSIALCSAVALSVIPLLGTAVWSVIPGFHGQYRRVQKLDLGNAFLRVILIGILWQCGINAFLAVLVGAVTGWVQYVVLRRWARECVDFGAPHNAEDRKELIRLSKKTLPNALFFCFQVQITLFVLALLGSPAGIADITALGRLSALLTVFGATFSTVLVPRFTRCQQPGRLPKLYLLLMGGAFSLLLPIFLFALAMPQPFLWLLGSKYVGLERELAWVVATAVVGQMASVMWQLNSSKSWIRFQSPWYIPTIVVVQLIVASCLDLREFHSVLIFNLATVAAPIPLYVMDAIAGLRSAGQENQQAKCLEIRTTRM